MIIVDTREQKPFWSGRHCMKTALIVGDYTTLKLLGKYHIERKSLQDLCGTITHGHLRFKKEIIRAKHYSIKLVLVVEGTRKQFEDKDFSGGHRREIEGKTLIKIIDTISRKHGLKVYWCKNREAAKKKIKNLLKP